MKQYTPKEVSEMIFQAKVDLELMVRLKAVLDHVPIKFTEKDFNFLAGWCPVSTDQYKSGQYIEMWKANIEEQLKKCEDSIKANTIWLEHARKNPFRCALPKKKQREFGLLPKI